MFLRGSVKDIEYLKSPKMNELGVGRFHFSDRYSIFDWGEMPDHIRSKGQSLCIMGAFNFEMMEKQGYKTHYRGLVTEDERLIGFEDIDNLGGEIPNIMEIKLSNVIKPEEKIVQDGSLIYEYDKYYTLYSSGFTYQIPTENIHRFYLPASSSIFKRLERGEVNIEDFGLRVHPKPGQKLETPIVDFSSKFEEGDRYVSRKEALSMTGFPIEKFESFAKDVLEMGLLISKRAEKVGLIYLDGKVEAFCYNNDYFWSDVVGTQDEGKFEFEGISTDKEVFREPYRILQPEWVGEIDRAKNESRLRGITDWKTLCQHKPKKLSDELLRIGSQIYMSSTNKYIKKKIFEVPSLTEVVKMYREWLNSHF